MPAPRSLVSARSIRGRAAALAAATIAMLGASFALPGAALAATDTVGTVTITAPAAADEGDTITVTIAADATNDLYAHDFVVTYDPALLEFDSAVFPARGHDSATADAGTVRLTTTRLGTSPGLSGALTLADVTFTVLDGGAATVTLTGATFIDSSGNESTLPAPVAADVALTAAPAAPEPSPSATASPSPTASASPTPSSTATPAAAAEASDPLAVTGGTTVVPLIVGAAALVLLALGVVLVIRRRKEATR